MFSTNAMYPGIPSHAPYSTNESVGGYDDRSALLANLRRPHQSQPPPRMMYDQSPPQFNAHQGGGYVSNEQQAYEYQQMQLQMQLRQMQLQNLEMQKQLLAQAAQAQAQAQQQQQWDAMPTSYAARSENSFSSPQRPADDFMSIRQQPNMERDWRSGNSTTMAAGDGARRDALQTLNRAQRQRESSVPVGGLEGRPAGSRLSFTGSDGQSLADRARARHSREFSASNMPVFEEPHVISPSTPVTSTPPPASSRHAVLSPPRPTLILSKPGEAFPQTSPPARSQHAKRDSSSSSASSVTSDLSNGSEVQSFESAATSVGGAVNDSPKLNPSAAAFTPACGIVAPPGVLAPTPPPVVTAMRARRFVNAAAGQQGVTAVRQPRGPPKEEELPSKNFASRIRRRAIGQIIRSRPSFNSIEGRPSTEDFGVVPSSPTVFVDE